MFHRRRGAEKPAAPMDSIAKMANYMEDNTDPMLDEERSDCRFVGLSNQGSTCYMNSLLQTLFMTPEFRRHLYMWRYSPQTHGQKEDSIPFQLQLLFSKLQLERVHSLETTGLTKSFQWDARDAFEQHDVQEFCRVLFEAIEQSVKNTLQERMIAELFEGVLVDYVKCETCGYESQREDKYLDISLAVRNDFDHIYNSTLEKALLNYIGTEHLSGSNAYFCSHCQSHQPAAKGLKFKRFPSILMIQLKRFDLDLETMQRVKINDKVEFPYILNLNAFIDRKEKMEIGEAETLKSKAKAQGNRRKNGDVEDVKPEDIEHLPLQYQQILRAETISHDLDIYPSEMDYIARKAHMDRKAAENRLKRQEDVERYRKEGDDVYELYSVLIHSGSAWGGHYYAYVRSFERDRWYCFNDSSVTEIEEKDIEKAFGGSVKKTWGLISSACAYLLVYRRIGPQNVNVIDDSEVPGYIMDEIGHERQREEQERKDLEEKKRILTVKVFYKGTDKLLDISKSSTLDDLKSICMSKFSLQSLNRDNIRLRGYDIYQDIFQETYTNREHFSLESLCLYNYKALVLEVKTDEEVFEEYVPGGITLKICVWTQGIAEQVNVTLAKKIQGALQLQMGRDDTLVMLLQKIEQKCGIPVSSQRVLRRSLNSGYYEKISRSEDYEKSMLMLRIYEGMALYVEDKTQASNWKYEFERELFRYQIKFNHIEAAKNDFVDFPNTVVVDSRETVKQLKERIGDLIGLSPDQFVMKRGSRQSTEIKELNLKISQSSLYNGGAVFIERGTPTRLDEQRVNLTYVERAKDAADYVLFKFTDLAELPLCITDTVEKAKTEICEKINSMYPSMQLDPLHFRLRERSNDLPTRTLLESETLNTYSLYERKPLCLQEFTDSVSVNSEDVSILIRKWSPATWELSDLHELFISRYATFEELGRVCAQVFEVPEEDLRLAKIAASWNFTREQLPSEHWLTLYGVKNRLYGNPWYLSHDGSLMM